MCLKEYQLGLGSTSLTLTCCVTLGRSLNLSVLYHYILINDIAAFFFYLAIQQSLVEEEALESVLLERKTVQFAIRIEAP